MRIRVIDDKDIENEIPVETILYVGHRVKNIPTPAPFPGSEMPCDICKVPVYYSTLNERIWSRPGIRVRCIECAAAGYDPHQGRVVVTKKSHDAVMKKIKEQTK